MSYFICSFTDKHAWSRALSSWLYLRKTPCFADKFDRYVYSFAALFDKYRIEDNVTIYQR